uniref:Uncharacterized protein n=1 Tax=Gasterosteus aculeatus aculeatus TaxID=481459 RepID=A0AAQ4QRZ5_GASAC
MESERVEGRTTRSQKHNRVNGRWGSLAPMVNSCKLHLTSVKSKPERAHKTFTVLQTDSQGEKNTPPCDPGCSGGFKFNAVPGFPFPRSSCDSFASSFQRIDMDRRCLEECPQLGIMDELQHLNLQHNQITGIRHLSHLQQLVFLNLYDNHISGMTGLESLRSLRILNLGKNRIREICCLGSLSQLNILDLHDNQICRIDNVSHLSELQTLNLAGNGISKVENLLGLDCLTELNLRHNRVSALVRLWDGGTGGVINRIFGVGL